MKRFLIEICCFYFCCTLVLSAPLYYFEYLSYHNNLTGPCFSINKVYNSDSINADLLIVGNSRANGYNDTLIGDILGLRCFNIGCPAYPIEFQYQIMFKSYLNRNVKPKYVLLDVSPFCMFKYYSPKHSLEFLPYLSHPEFSFYIDSCKVFEPSDRYFLPRYAGVIDKIVKTINSSNSRHTPKNEGYQIKMVITDPIPLEQEQDNLKALYDFISFCIEKDMKLIFVCSPMHEDHYLKFVDMNAFWKQIDNAVDGRDVVILNYERFYGSDTRYFGDLLHLNKYGCCHFSKKIAHDLDSLGIIPHQQNTHP